ncbi:hypothetical protein KKC32_04255 [Patescibacteria group bacterium]|nr:hypothetical protein [Patescibacteria group bacterium]
MFFEIYEIWRKAQVLSSRQIRWKSFLSAELQSRLQSDKGAQNQFEAECNEKIRVQSVLEHIYSFTIFLSWAIKKIRPYSELNETLLLNACLVHDWGEIVLEREVDAPKKVLSDDLDEYLAFKRDFGELDPEEFAEFQKAFLLQFAFSESAELFPPEEQEIFKILRESCATEARFFAVMEKIDYVMFGYEQLIERGNPAILKALLLRDVPAIESGVDDIRGFRQTVWTLEIPRAIMDSLKSFNEKN